MRRLALLLPPALLALALGAWLGLERWRAAGEAGPDEALLLSGTVEAAQVRPAFQVGGRIRQVLVEEGRQVREGELLAELETADLEAAVRLAEARREAAAAVLARLEAGCRPEEIQAGEASVREAEARLDFARSRLRRLKDLVPRGLAPPESLDQARSEKAVAAAALAAARERLALLRAASTALASRISSGRGPAREAALERARLRLGHARLRAPADGVVAVRLHEPGEVVAPGEPVMELDLMDRPWVRAYVSERQLPRIRLGQPAEVRADGLPGVVLRGTLAFVSPRAEYTPRTVETRELRVDLVYRIKVTVADPQRRLKLGMPVDLRLPLP